VVEKRRNLRINSISRCGLRIKHRVKYSVLFYGMDSNVRIKKTNLICVLMCLVNNSHVNFNKTIIPRLNLRKLLFKAFI